MVAGTGAGAGAPTSLFSATGVGVGGIFVAMALILLLAYLELYDASEFSNRQIRALALSGIAPLLVTFATILLFESLFVLG